MALKRLLPNVRLGVAGAPTAVQSANNITKAQTPAPSAPPTLESLPLNRFTTQRAILEAEFGDSSDGPHDGAKKFMEWALTSLAYEDVFDEDLSRTSYGKAHRDADLERTKRLCVTGTVVDIDGASANGERFYAGTLVDASSNPTLFIALGDAENIFADSTASFCGVFIGREAYLTRGGDHLVGLRVVGMFDTKANRRRTRAALQVGR